MESRINTYKVEELADILKCGVWKIYKMAEAGELPYFKVGNSYRFTESAILAWIKKQEDKNYKNRV